MLYADNANHLSMSAAERNRRREQLSYALNARGLETHEIVEASELAESLGAEIDGVAGDIRPTKARLARLRGALRRVAGGRRLISGREMERIVGHCTFVLLLNRPLLSALNHVYSFIRDHYHTQVIPGAQVRTELLRVHNVLVFARPNVKLDYDTRVLQSDASLSGYAVA